MLCILCLGFDQSSDFRPNFDLKPEPALNGNPGLLFPNRMSWAVDTNMMTMKITMMMIMMIFCISAIDFGT